jgi:hypothetical protein
LALGARWVRKKILPHLQQRDRRARANRKETLKEKPDWREGRFVLWRRLLQKNVL